MIAAEHKPSGKYQPYPEYKDSGVEWLGKVPSQWVAIRLKFIASINMGQSPNSEDCNDLGIGTPFLQGNAEFGLRFPMPKQYCNTAKKKANTGDFLFSVRAPVGAVNIADQRYGIGRGLCAIRANENIAHSYIWWVLQTSKIQFDAISTGSTFEAVSSEQVNNFALAIPPQNEQHTIAAFLDHETARIDRLIAKQQQLIELLKEKRQAVISHAVTKGLNPDAPMKDSGVEWLGQVPEHWGSSRVGWCCQVGNGCTPSRDNGDYWSEGTYPWLNSGKVNDGDIVSAEQFVTTKALKECSLPKVPAGSIVMAITGEGKTRGSVAITAIETTLSQHLAYIKVTSVKLSARFLRIWLESQYKKIRFESEGWGSTKAAITCSDIKSYPLPEPPLDEQLKIVEYIGEKNNKFDLLMQRSELMIAVLQERRTALISAAVTGKIDLRGWEQSDA